jgi:hypothetical protein
MRVYFGLGIFENPYANPDEAERTIRKKEFRKKPIWHSANPSCY